MTILWEKGIEIAFSFLHQFDLSGDIDGKHWQKFVSGERCAIFQWNFCHWNFSLKFVSGEVCAGELWCNYSCRCINIPTMAYKTCALHRICIWSMSINQKIFPYYILLYACMELKCKIPRTIKISSIFSFHFSFATTKLVFSAGVTRHAWPNREAVTYQNVWVFGKVSYILRLYLIIERCAYAKVNHQSCKICCQNKEGVKGCLKLSQNKILVCDDFPSELNNKYGTIMSFEGNSNYGIHSLSYIEVTCVAENMNSQWILHSERLGK